VAEYMGKYSSKDVSTGMHMVFFEYKYEYLFYQCTQVQALRHFKVLQHMYEYILVWVCSDMTCRLCMHLAFILPSAATLGTE